MSRLIFLILIGLVLLFWIPEAYATACPSSKEKKDLKVRCGVKGMMLFKAGGDNEIYGNEYCDWKPKTRGGEWTCRATCYWDCQIHVASVSPHEMLPCAHGDPNPIYLGGCTELVDKTIDLQHMTHEYPLRTESGDEESEDPRRTDEEMTKKCRKEKDDFVQKCQAPDLITSEVEVPGQCCVDPMFDLGNIN